MMPALTASMTEWQFILFTQHQKEI